VHPAPDFCKRARQASSYSVARSIVSCSQLHGTKAYLRVVTEMSLQENPTPSTRLGDTGILNNNLSFVITSFGAPPPLPAAAATGASPNRPQSHNAQPSLRPRRTLGLFMSSLPLHFLSHVCNHQHIDPCKTQISCMPHLRPRTHELGLDDSLEQLGECCTTWFPLLSYVSRRLKATGNHRLTVYAHFAPGTPPPSPFFIFIFIFYLSQQGKTQPRFCLLGGSSAVSALLVNPAGHRN
jgi:hypothetical protein